MAGPGTNDSSRGLQVIEITDKWAMGEFARCLVVVWRGQPNADSFRFRNEKLKDLVGRERGHCALVEIVEQGSTPPTDQDRRVAMEVFKDLGKDLSGVGFALEGSAMRTTLTRAILAGMGFFVKQMQPAKVFKHASDTAAWVRPLVNGDEAFEAGLVGAIEDLRKSIKPA